MNNGNPNDDSYMTNQDDNSSENENSKPVYLKNYKNPTFNLNMSLSNVS